MQISILPSVERELPLSRKLPVSHSFGAPGREDDSANGQRSPAGPPVHTVAVDGKLHSPPEHVVDNVKNSSLVEVSGVLNSCPRVERASFPSSSCPILEQIMEASALVKESAQTGTQEALLQTSTCPLRLVLLFSPPTSCTVFEIQGLAVVWKGRKGGEREIDSEHFKTELLRKKQTRSMQCNLI